VEKLTLFETPFVPGQMRLFGLLETLGEDGWIQAPRLEDYAVTKLRWQRCCSKTSSPTSALSRHRFARWSSTLHGHAKGKFESDRLAPPSAGVLGSLWRRAPMPGSDERGGTVPKGASVPVSLNHAIVFAEDKHESASFFTRLFALPEAGSWGPFRIVRLDNNGSVLFAEPGVEIQPQHYAFLVSEEDFDGIYGRMLEAGLEHWPDPLKSTSGTFNTNNEGRGVYFNDPAGHNLEVLTRP